MDIVTQHNCNDCVHNKVCTKAEKYNDIISALISNSGVISDSAVVSIECIYFIENDISGTATVRYL